MKRLIKKSDKIKYLYHGSPIQNLKILKPNVSTHGKNLVYATDDITLAILFIANNPYGRDKYLRLGQINKKTYIKEMEPNILEKAYDLSGSIYIISKEGFLANQTSFTKEFVCPNEVKILEEIKISNVYNYILNLEKENKILIKRFDN